MELNQKDPNLIVNDNKPKSWFADLFINEAPRSAGVRILKEYLVPELLDALAKSGDLLLRSIFKMPKRNPTTGTWSPTGQFISFISDVAQANTQKTPYNMVQPITNQAPVTDTSSLTTGGYVSDFTQVTFPTRVDAQMALDRLKDILEVRKQVLIAEILAQDPRGVKATPNDFLFGFLSLDNAAVYTVSNTDHRIDIPGTAVPVKRLQ